MITTTALRLLLAPQMRRFRRDLADPRAAQDRVLRDIVGGLARTERGREHGVVGIERYRCFTQKMPIVTYDELEPWIARQMAFETNQLVDEPVRFYQLTSGSTAPAKAIPTTASLKRSFSRMFALWLHDVLAKGPPLKTGRFYFSASETPPPQRTGRGVPIGSDSDLDYVAGALNALMRRYMVGLDEQPEVVSIWNPSFVLASAIRPIRSVKFVSCWADGEASRSVTALRDIFPNAVIQPKGLLATETPVTIPLYEACGFVPLVSDVFIELDDGVRIRRLHEAAIGDEYELILSQRAGLVRYRSGDRVRVTHRFANTPCLQFIGRADAVCDLVGEKLSEGFVRGVLATLARGRFSVVVPDRERTSYLVLVDQPCDDVEELLLASPRYAEARGNGQLGAARVIVDPNIEQRVLDAHCSIGMKRGDIKPQALIRNAHVAQTLAEMYAPALQ